MVWIVNQNQSYCSNIFYGSSTTTANIKATTNYCGYIRNNSSNTQDYRLTSLTLYCRASANTTMRLAVCLGDADYVYYNNSDSSGIEKLFSEPVTIVASSNYIQYVFNFTGRNQLFLYPGKYAYIYCNDANISNTSATIYFSGNMKTSWSSDPATPYRFFATVTEDEGTWRFVNQSLSVYNGKFHNYWRDVKTVNDDTYAAVGAQTTPYIGSWLNQTDSYQLITNIAMRIRQGTYDGHGNYNNRIRIQYNIYDGINHNGATATSNLITTTELSAYVKNSVTTVSGTDILIWTLIPSIHQRIIVAPNARVGFQMRAGLDNNLPDLSLSTGDNAVLITYDGYTPIETDDNNSQTYLSDNSNWHRFLVKTIPFNNFMYVYKDNSWKKAIPYVYANNHWELADAYVYNGSNWVAAVQ